MSQYKPYPAYKDSGVEWLGQVPENWVAGPLKTLLQIENGSDYKEVEADVGFPVIGSGGAFAYASKKMYEGESVLLGRKGTINKPLYVNGSFWTVDTMYWSIIKDGACGRFAYYVATTIPFDMYSTNTALPSMTKSVLGSHQIVFPQLHEQKKIAAYLDRETTRIDALITKKTRFIELLREKRQALITHAVTKGLDPNVKMKDSGVEWLGEVPEHWEVRPLKAALATMFNGTTAEQGPPLEGALRVTRIETISNGEINLNKVGYTIKTDSLLKYKLLAGDIQFSNINSLSMLGNAALFDGLVDPYAGMNLLVLRPKTNVIPRWLYKVIISSGFRKKVEITGKPAINQASINQGTLGALMIPLPSSEEQRAIADYLDCKIPCIDALIDTDFLESMFT